MKQFLAIYTGSETSAGHQAWEKLDEKARSERERAGMQAWMAWMQKNANQVIVQGGPLGSTKKVDSNGVSAITNAMVGYVVIQAESHEAAAKLFLGHPHFSIFPGDAVEIMECIPIPQHS